MIAYKKRNIWKVPKNVACHISHAATMLNSQQLIVNCQCVVFRTACTLSCEEKIKIKITEEMTEESEVWKLFNETRGDNNILTIGATVDTGLEWLAVDECREKFDSGMRIFKGRGKIYFNIALDDFSKVQEMRSIDNIFIVGDVRKFAFSNEDKESDLDLMKSAVMNDMNLEKYLNAWKVVSQFPGKMYPTYDEWKSAVDSYQVSRCIEEENLISSKGRKRGCDPSLLKDDSILSYRITCERTGKHCFESSQVATVVGGELQDKYHWIVDLTMYYLEIICKVTQDEMILNLRVTHESKHRRNIVHFGPTTLRATICYNLLRLAQPKIGDIIIDPMCGIGSIPIEASLAFPKTFVLCGDNNEKAVERTRMNIESLTKSQKVDLLKWSVTKLPFKNSHVDIFVTDMPFGRRSGTKSDNRVLYKKSLFELARVVTLKHGRVVLLTYDRRSINTAIQASRDLFHVARMLGVNIGGLNAAAYVLKRTNLNYEQFKIPFEKMFVKNTEKSETLMD